MTNEVSKELISGCLHPRQPGMKLVNVKFFRGHDDLIDSADFRETVHSASLQKVLSKYSSEAPRSAAPRIDVMDLVKSL